MQIYSSTILIQPVQEAVSYRRLFTAGWFGVREKHCSQLKIYDCLRASEQAGSLLAKAEQVAVAANDVVRLKRSIPRLGHTHCTPHTRFVSVLACALLTRQLRLLWIDGPIEERQQVGALSPSVRLSLGPSLFLYQWAKPWVSDPVRSNAPS